MEIKANVKVNLKDREVKDKVNKATEKSLKNVIIDIANAVIKPPSPIKTGHNRRSIAYKLGNISTRMGHIKSGERPFSTQEPQLKSGEGAVYSTSGYGGYLETGTRKMPARPYFKPALDRNVSKLPSGIKAELR